MIDLYVEYGFYKEHLISITKKGMDGQQQIAAMMESYRNHPQSRSMDQPLYNCWIMNYKKGSIHKQERSGKSNYPNQMCYNLS